MSPRSQLVAGKELTKTRLFPPHRAVPFSTPNMIGLFCFPEMTDEHITKRKSSSSGVLKSPTITSIHPVLLCLDNAFQTCAPHHDLQRLSTNSPGFQSGSSSPDGLNKCLHQRQVLFSACGRARTTSWRLKATISPRPTQGALPLRAPPRGLRKEAERTLLWEKIP